MKKKVSVVVYSSTRKPKLRRGRGFSVEEIRNAGLTLHEAKRLGISIDKRRKTSHAQNVQTLKRNYGIVVPLTKIRGIGKATEKKLIEANISDGNDLAQADLNVLAEKVGYSKKTLEKWQAEARKFLKK
ncbi:MAG: ribosomal protein L13e [Thermoproteota archaeon]|nr:ribosomal protein L13e [Thermoproteota archaeon]